MGNERTSKQKKHSTENYSRRWRAESDTLNQMGVSCKQVQSQNCQGTMHVSWWPENFVELRI